MVSERQAYGERLKRQRERSGISLAAISQITKVPASLYNGLERGNCARWPAGLYSRAYVRAYAEAIGLNPQQTVADFVAAFGETPSQQEPAAPGHKASAPHLRLSMAEEGAAQPEQLAKRSGLAAVDLLIGCLIVAIAHVGLDAGVWLSVAPALAYHAAGRVVSDEPLLYWLFERARHGSTPAAAEQASEKVAVGDAARTIA